MKYTDYLKAAKRHLHTSKIILENLNSNSGPEVLHSEQAKLIQNMYYLLGYVLECSLKYKILEAAGYCETLTVNNENCKEVGINYRKDLKTHNLDKLQNLLSSKLPDLHYSSQCIRINSLMENWSPDIRYITQQYDLDTVKSLYSHSQKFLREM